jgi:hypothetical protein
MIFFEILKIELGKVVEDFNVNPSIIFKEKNWFKNEKSPPLNVYFLKFWATLRITSFWKIAPRYHVLLRIKILR